MKRSTQVLIPPAGFAMVDRGIYRCHKKRLLINTNDDCSDQATQTIEISLFLLIWGTYFGTNCFILSSNCRIKTILFLCPEEYSEENLQFLSGIGGKLLQFGSGGNKVF